MNENRTSCSLERLAEVEAVASEEQRSARELFGEAVERYLSQRRRLRRDEVHDKIAQGLASLRQGKDSTANASRPN